MWALTQKEMEDQKEAEIDDLLEFAYELDYEKYMEDVEVRQALAIIKERVQDIKKDDDWKQKIAKEWNEAADEGPGGAQDDNYNNTYGEYRKKDDDAKSTISYRSNKTGMSKHSLRS